MGRIIRRVAVALSMVLAAVALWYRRVDAPRATESHVAPIETRGIASGVVALREGVPATPGWHSVTLPIDDVLAVASLIQPGSYVDVLVVPFDGSGGTAGRDRAETVAQNTRVLKVGRAGFRSNNEGRRARTVPLIVEVQSRAEVDGLIAAMRRGDLRYLLRSHPGSVVEVVPATSPISIPAPTPEVPCTNRRDSTLVYDAVLLSCARQPETILVDSAAAKRNRNR